MANTDSGEMGGINNGEAQISPEFQAQMDRLLNADFADRQNLEDELERDAASSQTEPTVVKPRTAEELFDIVEEFFSDKTIPTGEAIQFLRAFGPIVMGSVEFAETLGIKLF